MAAQREELNRKMEEDAKRVAAEAQGTLDKTEGLEQLTGGNSDGTKKATAEPAKSATELNTQAINAVKSGDSQKLITVIDSGADVNTIDSSDETHNYPILTLAVMNNNYAMAEYLVKSNANVNAKSNYDWSALHFALSSDINEDTLKTVQLLVGNGANVNDATTPTNANSNKYTPLKLAAILPSSALINKNREAYDLEYKRRAEIISYLQSKGATVDPTDKELQANINLILNH